MPPASVETSQLPGLQPKDVTIAVPETGITIRPRFNHDARVNSHAKPPLVLSAGPPAPRRGPPSVRCTANIAAGADDPAVRHASDEACLGVKPPRGRAVFGTEPDRSSFAGVAEGFLMSTTRRALLHSYNALAVALVLAVALIAFSPAPRAEAAPRPSSERLVKIAASERGTPYRAGGSGPGGFDCSGFTRWVYARAGKRLPRTSAAQAAATRNVPRKAARRGDLVFFHSGARVYHVGIYAGHGRLWHSPRPGQGVRLDRIWTGAHFFGRR